MTLIFRKKLNHAIAEKQIQVIMSYNTEYGVVTMGSWGVSGFWAKTVLSSHRGWRQSGRRNKRQAVEETGNKTKEPFRVTAPLTSSKWDGSWGIPMSLPPLCIFKSPLSGLHFQSFHVLTSHAGGEWDHVCPFWVFDLKLTCLDANIYSSLPFP